RALLRVRVVGMEHELFPIIAVAIVVGLVKLILQEFADGFRFGDCAYDLHATSFSRDLRATPRRKGIDTSTSRMVIVTICTTMTSFKLSWKRAMPTTVRPLITSCSQPVLAMRRDIS